MAGTALTLDYWLFGEAFGQPFSGIATDPNTGPLLVLLALALYPNRAPSRSVSDLTMTTAGTEPELAMVGSFEASPLAPGPI